MSHVPHQPVFELHRGVPLPLTLVRRTAFPPRCHHHLSLQTKQWLQPHSPAFSTSGPSTLTAYKSPTQSPDASKETRVDGQPAEGWLLGGRSTNTCFSQLSPAFQPAPVSLLCTCHSIQAWPILTPFNESHIEKAMKTKEMSKKNPTHKNGPLM